MKFNLNDKALVKKGLFGTFSIEIQTKEGTLKYSSSDFDEEFTQETIECEVIDALFADDVLTLAQTKEAFKVIHYSRMKQKNLLLRNQTIEYAWEKGFIYKYGSQADSELEDIFYDLEHMLQTTTIDAGADMDFHEAMTGESRL